MTLQEWIMKHSEEEWTQVVGQYLVPLYQVIWDAATEAERERAAKVAEYEEQNCKLAAVILAGNASLDMKQRAIEARDIADKIRKGLE